MQRLKNNLGAVILGCRRALLSRGARRAGRKPGGRLKACPTINLFLGFLILVVGAIAQTASEKPSADVRRVGARLQCQCGCKDSLSTCSMLECSFSKPAKERIARMQAAGFNDEQIVQAFLRDYGAGIYLARPSVFGWIVPYASLGAGLLVIWAFVKKYRKPKPLAELGSLKIDDPALEQYKEQIEEDLKKLD